jgi:hypothetical protein
MTGRLEEGMRGGLHEACHCEHSEGMRDNPQRIKDGKISIEIFTLSRHFPKEDIGQLSFPN